MPGERYWEIDLARGIAVVTMIIFHSAFDLNFLGVLQLNVYGGFLRMLAYLTASIFIFIVGVSFTISHARAARRLTGAIHCISGAVLRVLWPRHHPHHRDPHPFGMHRLWNPAPLIPILLAPCRGWRGNLPWAPPSSPPDTSQALFLAHGLSSGWIHPESFASLDYVPLLLVRPRPHRDDM